MLKSTWLYGEQGKQNILVGRGLSKKNPTVCTLAIFAVHLLSRWHLEMAGRASF